MQLPGIKKTQLIIQTERPSLIGIVMAYTCQNHPGLHSFIASIRATGKLGLS